MKTICNFLKPTAVGMFFLMFCQISFAQPFDSGSNGSYGPIDATSGNLLLQVPDDGIFHATTIDVGNAHYIQFIKNARNTPVYLLATSDVNIIARRLSAL